jgi:hypothetical protein
MTELLKGIGVHFDPQANFTTMALLIVALIWWIRGIPERKRAQTDSEAKFRLDLLRRIGELEELLSEERHACEERCKVLQTNLDGLQRQFITYQLAVAQAIPPSQRSAEVNAMVESLVQIEERKS